MMYCSDVAVNDCVLGAMFCSSCGHELSSDDNFCCMCGCKVIRQRSAGPGACLPYCTFASPYSVKVMTNIISKSYAICSGCTLSTM